jgi:hypothetical protein
MAQLITLEEAAEKLGMSPEEMKKRLKTDPEFRRLSQIRDGSTVRFKVSAIEELGRQLGQASDQGLPLAPMEAQDTPGSDDFKVPGIEDKKKAKKGDAPLEFDGSSSDEVFSLAEEPKPAGPKSTAKLTPEKQTPAKNLSDSSTGSSDSDVRLDGGKKKKDSDVKLDGGKSKKDEAAVPTEEIALDFSGPGSAVIKGGSSAKLSAPKASGSSGKLSSPDTGKSAAKGAPKPPADSSEFELSLDADSDDFDLQMNPDASSGDEVDLGSMPKEKGSGASSGKAGKSGINLREPSDSGISLEKPKKDAKDTKKDSKEKKTAEEAPDSDVDFELSLDSSSAVSSSKLGAPKSGKLVLDSDSDSEFELTLDDSGGSSLEQAALGADQIEESGGDKGDIFETDFEIPPMPDESGSEAVALESDTDIEKSDFELAMDDSDVPAEESSQSEVVLLEDEEGGAGAKAKKAKPAPKSKTKKLTAPADEGDVDLAGADVMADEDDVSASKALKGVKGKRRRDDDDEEEEEAAPAGAVVERPTKPWGPVPAIFLGLTLPIVLLGALMSYEMLQTMWGYQQPRKPAAPIIRGLATNLDMELRDQ